MSNIQGIILVVSILVAVIGITAAVSLLEKKFPVKEFDERQQLIQGRGYRLAFYAGLAYFMPVTIWQMFLAEAGKPYLDIYFILFLGLWLEVLLFETYCLWHGAALPLSDKPTWAIGTSLFFAGYYLLKYIGYGRELNRNGLKMLPLMMGIGFVYLAVLHLIAYLRDRKE